MARSFSLRPPRLADLPIRGKLLGSFGLVLVLLLVLSAGSYLTVLLNEDADARLAQTREVIARANQAFSILLEMQGSYRGFLLTGSQVFLQPYDEGRREFAAASAEVRALISGDPVQTARWHEIERRAAAWQTEVAEPGIALRQQSPDATALENASAWVATGEGRGRFDAIRVRFAEFLNAAEVRLDERIQAAAEANQRLRQVLLLGTVVAVALGIGLALLLARDVAVPMQRLASTAGALSTGDLSQRIGLDRRDEIGEAATAFDQMAARLQTALDESEARARELERSNADLEQFAYVASHDLQEPLRAVVSYVQLLEKRYRDQLDERAQKYIAYAVDGGRRMQTLIQDLLVYSRVGRQEGEPAVVDATAALERALTNLRVTIAENEAEITHDPLPTLYMDPGQLVQVFQNLVGNAVKFRGNAPPRVHVSAQRQDGQWRFAVRDNGVGIDPQYAERIFVIFQRLHGRDAYGGTGIGLAVCKKIVERHGGTIWVDSRPGAGATFFFTLPAVPTEAATAPPSSTATALEPV